jgi:hypothetical protein
MVDQGTETPEEPMTFARLKEETAKDCESVAERLTELAAEVREGNVRAFEDFFFADESQDDSMPVYDRLRMMALMRYYGRSQQLEAAKSEAPSEKGD